MSSSAQAATATAATATTSIHEATEHYLQVDTIDVDETTTTDIQIWYRVWGNPNGIPVLFVHGGPGNCVAHYGSINADFFDADSYWVVEVDQRGTGRSAPSVQDLKMDHGADEDNGERVNAGVRNMAYYRHINIRQMSADFDRVRKQLNVDKWLVFGGSWGSALGLDYAQRYPKDCLGLVVRGIFLSTEEEMNDVYTLGAMEALAETQDDRRYVTEFDTFYEVADREFRNQLGTEATLQFAGRPFRGTTNTNTNNAQLSPNDARGILQVYEHLIQKGDREAIWKFFVYECNLMEEDPAALLDPETILNDDFAEAQSVSFFETRLFLNGVYESTTTDDGIDGDGDAADAAGFDLLKSVSQLTNNVGPPEEHYRVPTWVVQGTGDVVCPDKYAATLVHELNSVGVLMNSHFVDAGHKASSRGIHDKLVDVVNEFYEMYHEGKEEK